MGIKIELELTLSEFETLEHIVEEHDYPDVPTLLYKLINAASLLATGETSTGDEDAWERKNAVEEL